MILLSLELANFKQFREAKIDMREGLVGIVGRNGTGKSTLFDAILLALYGDIPGEKEYLRFQKAGEREAVGVSLRMLIENREYFIRREFRGKALTASAELKCNDSLIASGQKEVTAEIGRIMGMGGDAFSRSIFAGQKELGLLSGLADADRKAFIRKILGVTKIDEIQKSVRADGLRIKDEIFGQGKMLLPDELASEKSRELGSLGDAALRLQADLTGAEKKLGEHEAIYAGSKQGYFTEQKKKDDFAKIEASLAGLVSKSEQLEKQIGENLKKQKEIHGQANRLSELEKLEDEYAESTARLDFLEKEKKSFDQAEVIAGQIQETSREIRTMLSDLVTAQPGLAELDDPALFQKQLEKKLGEAEALKQKASESRNSAQAGLLTCRCAVDERRKSLETLSLGGADSRCPTCLRPLADALPATLKKLDDEIGEHSKNLAELEEAAARADESHRTFGEQEKNLREKLQDFRIRLTRISQKQETKGRDEKKLSAMGKINFSKEEYERVKNRMRELKERHEEYIRLVERKKELPRLEKDHAALTAERSTTAENAKGAESRRVKTGFSEKAFEAALASMRESEEARDATAKKLSVIRDELKDKKHAHSIIERQLAENKRIKNSIAGREKEAAGLDKLVVLLDGFKTAILGRIQPLVAHYASGLFSKLTRGRYESIHVDEDFRFLIHDEGDYFPITRFSGGEQDLANLCLRLALSRAIRDLEGAAAPSFLGFDEIFGSQDRERRYEILQALLLLQEQYRQILIISHDEELKDEFPNILEVRRTQSGAVVKWLDCS